MTGLPYPNLWCGQAQPHNPHTWIQPNNFYASCAGHTGTEPHNHGLICRPEQSLRCIDCGQTYFICKVCHKDVYGHHEKCEGPRE